MSVFVSWFDWVGADGAPAQSFLGSALAKWGRGARLLKELLAFPHVGECFVVEFPPTRNVLMSPLFSGGPRIRPSFSASFVAVTVSSVLAVFACLPGSYATDFPESGASALPDVAYQVGSAPPTRGSESPGAEMGQGLKNAQTWSADNQGVTVKSDEAQVQTPQADPLGVYGLDVSGWQPNVDWPLEYSKGARFAYVKATEGIYYTSPTFSSQYWGAESVGMLRGGYHFALPVQSSGAEQARFFVANGGGWTPDGRTLPGLLDIEYNPYSQFGNVCYNMSQGQMIAWIAEFTETYRALTGRYPAVYSTTDWWRTCTGDTTRFNYLPLHLASYSSVPGAMPAGWATYDIWQFSSTGPFAGDSNYFSGSARDLRAFATFFNYRPAGGVSPYQAPADFHDVPASHGFGSEINWLASSGVAQGWGDGSFRPDESISREAMAAFMYRLAGSPAYTPPQISRFRDVPTTHQFYKEISWLADRGIAQGWSDGTYRPGQSISREAMAVFLYRLAGEPATGGGAVFSDVPARHAFAREIRWCADQGIMRGWADGSFRPQEPTSRAAMAAFMYRYVYRS